MIILSIILNVKETWANIVLKYGFDIGKVIIDNYKNDWFVDWSIH